MVSVQLSAFSFQPMKEVPIRLSPISLLTLTLMTFATGATSVAQARTLTPAGRVTALAGETVTQEPGAISSHALIRGNEVYRGSRITTRSESRLKLLLGEEVLLTLAGESEITIGVAGKDTSPEATEEVKVGRGSLRAVVGKGVKLVLRTPTLVVEAGDASIGLVVKEFGETTLVVFAGEALYRGVWEGAPTATIRAGSLLPPLSSQEGGKKVTVAGAVTTFAEVAPALAEATRLREPVPEAIELHRVLLPGRDLRPASNPPDTLAPSGELPSPEAPSPKPPSPAGGLDLLTLPDPPAHSTASPIEAGISRDSGGIATTLLKVNRAQGVGGEPPPP